MTNQKQVKCDNSRCKEYNESCHYNCGSVWACAVIVADCPYRKPAPKKKGKGKEHGKGQKQKKKDA